MFTGIITDIGTVRSVERVDGGDTRIAIATELDLGDAALGASIACAGVCLTVVEKDDEGFAVDASDETLARTTVGTWTRGTRINLERPLRIGDELGGHIVSGHVDDVGSIAAIEPVGESHRVDLSMAEQFSRYVARKGSIAVDGVSLTVNAVGETDFSVNIIPFTWERTTFADRSPGDSVNLEIDMLARYVARLGERS